MKTLLDLHLSARGTPSEVRDRITTQVAAASDTPEQATALATIRTFIEKSIAGASEDDTLAVSGSIVVSVSDAPPIVLQKVLAVQAQAEKDRTVAANTIADLTAQLTATKAELELVQSGASAAPVVTSQG